MTEKELVKGCAQEKRSFQELLYQQYYKKMFAVCMRYGKDRDQALDMLQEGFIKVYNNINSFNHSGSLEGWIRRIMVNSAINLIRKEKPTIDINNVYEDRNVITKETVLDKMSADEIMELIQKLPHGYKTVFNLFAIEGYSHKEIAEMLDIQESTSRTQFLKAKTALKKMLEELKTPIRNVE